ncbi:MAG: NAD(P)-dependent alcohol dehydrogenase [Bacteroidetes bacterium HGW-Bacteroidetes-8]|jgi:NADPH:quinone reductase-like Zn-dependent oxidoreductase|nr:MAG: NAD(P)-dependent alcohol dehydrogenase [Bacteroidetes bacterium HGW-Bacteroidetes-8]
MKAIVHSKYGPPDELQLKEVQKPVPKENEVLIKIHATTVTTTDCNARNFTFVPKSFMFFARLVFGFKTPKINILGIDLAGEIEAVGKDVKLFKKGDQVFGSPGTKFGAHAEYVCVPEDGALAIKPASMSWEEAAAISLAGNTALFFIRDLAKIQAGQKILIHGASGAIGTYAVQLAKFYGAEVTGVCSSTNAQMVKSLGADKIIDYTKEDFTKTDERYDFVFDVVGKTTFSQCKGILKQKGIYLENNLELKDILIMMWRSLVGGKKIKGGVSIESAENLNFFIELIESGKLKPVIDKTFPLEKTAEAFRYVELGHKKGNVVIINQSFNCNF